MKGLILFIVAIILTVISSVVSFLYHLFSGKWKRGTKKLSDWFTVLALSMDQFGNGSTGEFFKVLFIKKSKRSTCYDFGNIDETVSFVLALNKRMNALNKFGRIIALILEGIDPGHLETSIEKQKENDKRGADRFTNNAYYAE